MQSFRNVTAWHKAHQLTLEVFQITEDFPKSEAFGLAVQLRRYAMNTPLRIAEGCGKTSDAEFISACNRPVQTW
jgi:four helix bundle protein